MISQQSSKAESQSGTRARVRPRVCVAQIGARRHYALPAAIESIGFLERLYTDIYLDNLPFAYSSLNLAQKVLPIKRVKRLLGRRCPDLPASKVDSFEFETIRSSASKFFGRLIGKDVQQQSSVYASAGREFANWVVEQGFGEANTVYGFNAAAVEIFEAAKTQGIACVLDQTILPMQQFTSIMRTEMERWPGWQPDVFVDDDYQELIDRDQREWELADAIICGSEYLADAVGRAGGPRQKCHVVPYGFEINRTSQSNSSHETGNDDATGLRLLFVGEVGIRKGAPYLLEATKQLESEGVCLRLAGRVKLDESKIAAYTGCAKFLGHVPRAELSDLYQWADALVMPSLCEGSAMVTYEAMAHDLPVICTASTGANLREGIDGIIVPQQSVSALVDAFNRLPQFLNDRRNHLKKLDESSHSTQRYQTSLKHILENLHE